MINLWRGRRDKFLQCEYWSQDENEDYVNNSEILYKRRPDGLFYAKEINSYSHEMESIGEVFLMNQEGVTIQTEDDVKNLKVNDKVLIRDKMYRVDGIQRRPIKKEMQYLKDEYSCEYIISLRR